MEYNNYYPGQSEHLSPNLANHQHSGPQMQSLQQQQPPPPPPPTMMHSSMPAQNARQPMNAGPHTPNQHQQHIQQQQQQIMPPQQQQQQQHHAHYHQPPQSHGPPVSHSSSPHGQHQPPSEGQNIQPSLNGPPPQSAVQSQQQHHVHPPPPYHHAGPQHMHMQQQQQPPQPQQQLNHMVRSSLGPSVINHPHIGLQQPPPPPSIHHHQNFFSGAPMPPQPSSVHHHFPQQNQQHTIHHPFQHHQHHHHPPHQPQMMHPHNNHHHHHHHAPPPMGGMHHPGNMQQQGIGRSSPYYPGILQTELRVIELNRRLQSRPIQRYPISPLPNLGNPYDEGVWWERFASEFFEDDATLTLRMQEDKPVEFTIGRTLIPKFFRTYFDGGVTDLSINLRNPKETCTHPHLITLDCDQAFIVTNNIYKHPAISSNQPVVVHTEGRLVLEFVNNIDALSIKSWRFFTKGCREYIDRSIIALGLPNAFLVEPVTRQGLTKSTVSYLRMCMIMEPMQDIIVLHRHTKLDPRSCMQKLLVDRYKFRTVDDGRATTNKRRKRKPSAAPAVSGPTTGRKSKANMANIANNNIGLNNNNMMVSPSNAPSFSLASQDVMVVGEPSMMGGDFGDDNERMITRLENTQYDPSAATPQNAKLPEGLAGPNSSQSSMSLGSVGMASNNHTVNLPMLQHRAQHEPPHIQTSGNQPQQQQHMHHERMEVQPSQEPIDSDMVEKLDQSQVQDVSQQSSQESLQPSPHQSLPQSQLLSQQQQLSQEQQQSQSQLQQQSPQQQQQLPQPQQHTPPQQPHQLDQNEHQYQPQQSPQQIQLQETQPHSIEQTQTGHTTSSLQKSNHEFGLTTINHDHEVKNTDHSVPKEEEPQQNNQSELNSQPSQSDSQADLSQSQQSEVCGADQVADQNNSDLKPNVEKNVEESLDGQEQTKSMDGADEKGRDEVLSIKTEPTKTQNMNMNSVEQIDLNHTNSVQTINDESNPDSSQSACGPNSTAVSAREQKQPVDNGVT